MKHKTSKNKKRLQVPCFRLHDSGFSVIEAVVALGLLALTAGAFLQLNLALSRRAAATKMEVEAGALAAETMEALKSLRDENWSNLTNLNPGADYFLSFSETSKKWLMAESNPDFSGVFERSFRVWPVYRDAATGRAAESGGALDAGTLRAEASVKWNERGTLKERKLVSYIANL